MTVFNDMADIYGEFCDQINHTYENKEIAIAIARAQHRDGDISTITNQYNSDINAMREEYLPRFKTVADTVRAGASARVTAPVDQDTANLLELLKTRTSIGAEEYAALAERYGKTYQGMAGLAELVNDDNDPMNLHGNPLFVPGREYEVLCEYLGKCVNLMNVLVANADPAKPKEAAVSSLNSEILLRGPDNFFAVADACANALEQYSL